MDVDVGKLWFEGWRASQTLRGQSRRGGAPVDMNVGELRPERW